MPLAAVVLPVSTFSDWLFSQGQTSAVDCSLEEVWTLCGKELEKEGPEDPG